MVWIGLVWFGRSPFQTKPYQTIPVDWVLIVHTKSTPRKVRNGDSFAAVFRSPNHIKPILSWGELDKVQIHPTKGLDY